MLVFRPKPLPITDDAIQNLCRGGRVIEQDGHGLKVIKLTDGTYLKFFRRKRVFSSATLWPYAHRFVANSRRLNERGVPAPVVLGFFQTLDNQRMIVHYAPVEGESLKVLIESGNAPGDLAKRAAEFIRDLHDKGVYFRSLHPANIIFMANKNFGLIDVSDLKFLNRSLPPRLRARNINHLTRLKNEPTQTDQFQKSLAEQLTRKKLEH